MRLFFHARSSCVPGVVLAAGMMLLAGCRDPRDPNACWVSGKVTFDGSSLVDADLSFTPTDERLGVVACKVVQGGFKMRVPPGEHVVRILAHREVPRKQPQQPGMPPGDTDLVQYLPDRYNKTTQLKVEVKKSGDAFAFDLDSKPDPANPAPVTPAPKK